MQRYRHGWRIICHGLTAVVFFALITVDGLAQEKGKEEGKKRVGVPRGIYDKPYIARLGRGTAIGGYMDQELEFTFDDESGLKALTFDQQRFIPFLYSEITDRLHVATEIEFEHGGNPEEGGEVKLEFAALDFMIREWLVFRGGIILSPLGYFNLVHDSPWNDLTARPLVNRQIIPTTLAESGMGFHGTIYPNDLTVLNYELYLVNGFNTAILQDLDGDGTPDQVRIRKGRGSLKEDNNKGKSIVGRLSWSPRLGVQLGGSFHVGPYSDTGSDYLSIYALDVEFNRGPVQFLGEYASARISLDNFRLDAQRQHGFYLQGNYHILADQILPGSVFTAIVRYDYVNFALSGPLSDETDDTLTLGLNYRPVEDTVFKLDWGFKWINPPGGGRVYAGSTLFFSLATYF